MTSITVTPSTTDAKARGGVTRRRILFTTVPSYGHAHSVTALARAARERGHDVLVATSASFGNLLEASGVPVEAAGIDWMGDPSGSFDPVRQLTPERRTRWVHDVLHGDILPKRMLPDVLSIIERFQPNAVVSGRAERAGPTAAELTGLPYVIVNAGLHRMTGRPPVSISFNELRNSYGLPRIYQWQHFLRYCFLDSVPDFLQDPDLQRVNTRKLFRLTDGGLRHPLEGTISGEALLPRPTLFVTMGTIANRAEILRAVLQSLHSDYNLVVSVGPNVDPGSMGIHPPSTVVHRWVSQSDVLRICDAVICHGGLNTVVSALAQGLPLVLIPLLSDQPRIARRCSQLGVGRTLDWVTLQPRTVQEAVASVMSEPSYKRQATRLGSQVRALPSIESAIHEVVGLCR
jgi:UDP:flavonoid glycosyltransferase YjiC (YdhE family)